MTHRITVRGTGLELRGTIEDLSTVLAFAAVMQPFGLVIASELPQVGASTESPTRGGE